MKALLAQIRAEVTMTLRRGETLLLTVGIPVLFLVFFSSVSVISTPTIARVDFIAPGILALATMSTALVSLSIATGFERGYGVLKRLGSTPLGRQRLLAAKICAIAVVEAIQFAILVPVALTLGWHLSGSVSRFFVLAIVLVALATISFAGIGLAMAGRLRAEVNLAAANGLYLVFLLLGGMIVPLAKLPSSVAAVARLLPPAALSDGLHGLASRACAVPTQSWVVLIIWAIAAPVTAAMVFRWE